MSSRRLRLASDTNDIEYRVMSYYFSPLVADASRQCHRGQAGLHRRSEIVQVSLSVRNHAEVGDFDTPKAMLARKIDTSTKMLVRRAHAASGVISIAQPS
jgi:hypothetical protein